MPTGSKGSSTILSREVDTITLGDAPLQADQEARDLWRPGWGADEDVQIVHRHGGNEQWLLQCLQALRSSWNPRAGRPRSRRARHRFGRC